MVSMSEIQTFLQVADTAGEADYNVCQDCGNYNHPRRHKCICGRKTNTMHMTVQEFEASWAEAHTAHQ